MAYPPSLVVAGRLSSRVYRPVQAAQLSKPVPSFPEHSLTFARHEGPFSSIRHPLASDDEYWKRNPELMKAMLQRKAFDIVTSRAQTGETETVEASGVWVSPPGTFSQITMPPLCIE